MTATHHTPFETIVEYFENGFDDYTNDADVAYLLGIIQGMRAWLDTRITELAPAAPTRATLEKVRAHLTTLIDGATETERTPE